MITRSAPDAGGHGAHSGPVRPATGPFARHGRQANPSAPSVLLKLAGLALGVLLVSSIAVAGIAVIDVTSSLKPGVSLPGDTGGAAPQIDAIDGGVNLLLVGSDSAEDDPAFGPRGDPLGDVTMLLHISADHSSASVISFPRDLLVTIPACAAAPAEGTPGTSGGFTDKINSALAYGGLSCAVAAVTQLTGLSIPFAAQIEFQGVIAMSNAVGGVAVCVAEPINDPYTGTFLDAGEHVLSGIAALQFLRTRHGLTSGSDLARISNQQAFLASLMRTVTSDGTLANPLALYGLAKAAAANMRLSTSLQNLDTMVSIGVALRGIGLERVAFVQYPVDDVSGGLAPREEDAELLMGALAADVPLQIGALGPASSEAPSDPPPASIASSAPSAAPSDGPAPPAATPVPEPTSVLLPPSVSGQTAAERTCAVGQ